MKQKRKKVLDKKEGFIVVGEGGLIFDKTFCLYRSDALDEAKELAKCFPYKSDRRALKVVRVEQIFKER